MRYIIILILLLFIFFITTESFNDAPDYFENYGWAPWGRTTEWYRGKWYIGGNIGERVY